MYPRSKMSRSQEQLVSCSCPSSRSVEDGLTESSSESSPSTEKLNFRLPTTKSSSSSSSIHLKFPLRHVILLVFVLTLSSHVHNANSQPLLNQLAVLLRARPPWPTSFPTAASQNKNPQQNQNQNQQNQQQNGQQRPLQNQQNQQQQQSQSVQQQIQVPPNSPSVNVYATSSEQLQNFISSNNLLPLNQGIPVVAMDPAQNSITIVTPSGPDQIVGPNQSGNGGNVFVAQPFQPSNGTGQGQPSASSVQNSGPMVHVMPSFGGLDGQNLLDNNFLSGFGLQHPNQGGANQQQPQGFPAGFLMNPPQNNLNGNQNNNKPQHTGPGAPPPPPPIPKNFKGPAIIAVPKNAPPPPNQNQVLIPPGNFLSNNNFQRFLPQHAVGSNANGPIRQQNRPGQIRGQHIMQNQPGRPGGNRGPIIIHSLQQPHPQLPSIANGFRPFIPHNAVLPHSHEHLISLPENALMNMEINKTNNMNFGQFLEPQVQQIQFHKEIQSLNSESGSGELFPHRERSTTTMANELSSDYTGGPRFHRKRQFKKQLRQQKQQKLEDSDEREKPLAVLVQYQHHSNRGNILNRFKPTARPTQIPLPGSDSEGGSSNRNEIDNRQVSTSAYSETSSPLAADYSLSTIINMPSTTVTGSFEYPDPPTPPNYQSMNALKFPSPTEDSAEVVMRNIPVPTKPRMREQPKTIMNPFLELKKRVRTGSSTTHPVPSAGASSLYRSVTTASAGMLPAKSTFDIETDFRDANAYIQSRDILARIREPRPKSQNDKSFRPSPQIHSFEEPVTGVRSYITILPPAASQESNELKNSRERGKKSLGSGKLQGSESRIPFLEQGFKPVNHYANNYGVGTMPPPSSTTETLYFDLIREVVSNAPPRDPWGNNDRLTVTMPNHPSYVTMGSSTSLEESFIKAGWKVRDGEEGEPKRQVTTDSSERVEDWKHPNNPDGSRTSSKIYFGNGKFGPPNCDKFHRFGFCPMNSGYPAEQVEKIASRCSALLSHLIAPLPKADVRYDVIVAKNGSMLKGKSAAPSGWSWKSFSGKPVCDTKEIKVVPGWAKDEQGEWLVILQTKAWKQEAQITLCTPQGTTYNSCKGNNKDDCTPIKIKCVQRFTAQRLAVLDPENTDRCPVLRSVFLPSACVCLNDNSSERGHRGRGDNSNNSNSSLSSLVTSSEELSASSSNSKTNSIKKPASASGESSNNSKGSSRSSSGRKSGKGKVSSKGRKSSYSKKSKSGRRNSTRKSEENTSVASVSRSSEEDLRNKDMLDTAADSSTSVGAAALIMGSHMPSMRPQEEDEEVSPEEDEAENDDDDEGDADDATEERPRAEPLISSPSEKHEVSVTARDESEPEERQNSSNSSSQQNEVEDEDNVMGSADSLGDHASKVAKPTAITNTNPTTTEEEESDRVTTTIASDTENEVEKSEKDGNNSSDDEKAKVEHED